MRNCVIIESEQASILALKKILSTYELPLEIKGIATNVNEAIILINSEKPDLVFLNLELDGGLGFKVLEVFSETLFKTVLIKAPDSIHESSSHHVPLAYLEKPIDKLLLEKVLLEFFWKEINYIEKSKNFISIPEEKRSSILIQSGHTHYYILFKEIIYLKADSNYTLFILTDKRQILANHGLGYYETLLGQDGFFKANRSTLLNISHISHIYKKESIELSDKNKITVSFRNRSRLSELIETLKKA